MGAEGDVERKTEDDRKGTRRRRRREAADEPAAHGGEQPFQRGAAGNNPQVQGHVSADNGGRVNLGENKPQVQEHTSAANEGIVNLYLQVTGGSVVHLGFQGGSNPQVKRFSCADCGKRGAMSTKKNNVFNAVMDDEMLTLLQEQIKMGKKGDRGFKEEAYIAVASAMTESSNGSYVMTSSSVKNRYEYLKQLYYAMKEMTIASGFRYDRVSNRVVADEALWNTWLEGHPTARPLKTESIDYEKMDLVCGNDMATGQFARSSSSASSVDLMKESSNYSNSDDDPIRVDDLECDSKGGGTSGESSLKKKEVRMRARDEVLVTGMKESPILVQRALDNPADSITNWEAHKRIGDEVYRELMKIEGLTRNHIVVIHEWLTLRKGMAAVFLSHGDKKEWILRRLHRIHAASDTTNLYHEIGCLILCFSFCAWIFGILDRRWWEGTIS